MPGPHFAVSEVKSVGYSASAAVGDCAAQRGIEALSIDRDASSDPHGPSARSADGKRRRKATGNGEGLSVDHLSQSLRQAYESTLNEAIPDVLSDLLRKLD